MWYEPLLENGLFPDSIIRLGIRHQLRTRLRQQSDARNAAKQDAFWNDLETGPIATKTNEANKQHYEVPTAFFRHILGPRFKYSSGYWQGDFDDLESSELAMLQLYMERARLGNKQRILDLGCGWGSLSLFLAEHLPNSDIVAISNSTTQKAFIDARASELKLTNLHVIRANVNDFQPDTRFDRILSIEMFEHMRNYRLLLDRIRQWLKPDGLLFVHHFAHRNTAYPFIAGASNEWMAKHFFSGGIMPSANLLNRFAGTMNVIDRWQINGRHYQQTCEAWLARLSENRQAILELLTTSYGRKEAHKQFNHWRVFFMACAELFGYRRGSEWFIVHALLAAPCAAHGNKTRN